VTADTIVVNEEKQSEQISDSTILPFALTKVVDG
jgi:hypothetical protein